MMELPSISFGEDIRQPSRLQTRNTADVLSGIRDGNWRHSVARVRELPADSPAQKEAKIQLPYCLWSGVFSRRSNDGLLHHSGQVGIDLDGLGEAGAVRVIQSAVADRFCFSAYHSTRGSGVRLIFRIPPCSPENHVRAFEQVALHVRRIYNCEPDHSGKDVARASFVSFDRGLWLNPSAELLPLILPDDTQRYLKRNSLCVTPYAGQLAETWATWYGRHIANTSPCKDGTVKTHRSLLDLGKHVALHAYKINVPVTPRLMDAAFEAWLRELQRQGLTLRGSPDEYRREFIGSVKGAERKPWFRSAAEKWLRWIRHADFPQGGLPHEKLLFAIRQHCAGGSGEFFLGVRDAALVAGVSKETAGRLLRKLCADGHLEKLGERRQPRHAQNYRLPHPKAKE